MVSDRDNAGHWRARIAAGGLILAAILICYHVSTKDYDASQADHKASKSPDRPGVGPIPTNAFLHDPRCQAPNGDAYQGQCVAWQSMAAAKEQAKWAAWTWCVAALGTLFVAITLRYTRVAASAALRATLLAEKALTDLERPHIFVSVSPQPIGVKIVGDIYSPFVDFSISNFGRAPAEIIRVYAGTCVGEALPGRPRPFETGHHVVGTSQTLSGNQISLGDEVPIKYEADDLGRPDRTQPVPAAEPPLSTYFRVDIDYKGIAPNSYTSEFAWRWDDDAVIWSPEHSRRT